MTKRKQQNPPPDHIVKCGDFQLDTRITHAYPHMCCICLHCKFTTDQSRPSGGEPYCGLKREDFIW